MATLLCSTNRRRQGALTALAFFCCFEARADLNQTVTLATGAFLSLDTGAIGVGPTRGSTVYDLQWTGTSLTPQGRARTGNVGVLSASEFDTFSE